MNSESEQFTFSLSNINKLKPKNIIDATSIDTLINRQQNISNVVNNLAHENFETNETFPMKDEEKHLIKTFQSLTQYMMYSINHLEKKKNLLEELIGQQGNYTNKAGEFIYNQNAKIKNLEKRNRDLSDNLMSMEFLVKSMGIDVDIGKLNEKKILNTEDVTLNQDQDKENDQDQEINDYDELINDTNDENKYKEISKEEYNYNEENNDKIVNETNEVDNIDYNSIEEIINSNNNNEMNMSEVEKNNNSQDDLVLSNNDYI